MRRLFLAFQCESFVYDDFAVGENGEPAPTSKLYLTASLNVECHAYLQPGGSTDHLPILVTAWAFIVLWPLAMPLLYAVLLFRCRTAVQNHQPSSLSRATRFLWSEYEDDYYWYEMVELTTKLLLTNFLLFVNFESGSDKFLRLFIGLLIAIFALTTQLVLRPFRKASDDAIASVVRLLQVLFFVLGIMVKLCETEGPLAIYRLLDAKVEDSCGTLVGVATSYSVSVLILFAGLMAVLVPLGMLTWQLAFSRAIPILRVASTMEPPVVLLRKGERYHLFLCATPPEASAGPCNAATDPPRRPHPRQEPRVEHWSRSVRDHQAAAPAADAGRRRLPGRRRYAATAPVPPPPRSCLPTSAPIPCNRPGRSPGYRGPRELCARNRRDALLPVKALFQLAQLPARSACVARGELCEAARAAS